MITVTLVEVVVIIISFIIHNTWFVSVGGSSSSSSCSCGSLGIVVVRLIDDEQIANELKSRIRFGDEIL